MGKNFQTNAKKIDPNELLRERLFTGAISLPRTLTNPTIPKAYKEIWSRRGAKGQQQLTDKLAMTDERLEGPVGGSRLKCPKEGS